MGRQQRTVQTGGRLENREGESIVAKDTEKKADTGKLCIYFSKVNRSRERSQEQSTAVERWHQLVSEGF